MRALIAILTAGALVIPGTTAMATPAKPKPDLTTSSVSATSSGSSLTVLAAVQNKGKKKAKASAAGIYLSSDSVIGAGDTLVGTAPVGRLKPHRSGTFSVTLTLPTSTAAGDYHVIVCADFDDKVQEKKEGNNCAASAAAVAVASQMVTISFRSYQASAAISVSMTGGVGTCNVPETTSAVTSSCVAQAGSKVVLTGVAHTGYSWNNGAWDSFNAKPCDGTPTAFAGSSNTMTLANVNHDEACEAHAPANGS
jgi:subtilase family serine protease